MGIFSHADLTKTDHFQTHLTKISLCLFRQVRFSHANLTKLGVRFVNSTVNPVDLTNSWENYLVLSVDLTKNYSRYVYQREDVNPPVDLTNFGNVELAFPL